MRILLLEDNAVDAELIVHELAGRTGAPPTVARTLAEANALLAAPGGFDLLLVDLHLPDGSALDWLAQLRSQGLELTVVTLTGLGSEHLAMAALRAGADDYLVKRSDAGEELLATLRAAHQRRLQRRALVSRPLQVLYIEPQALDLDLTRRHFEAHAPHLRLRAVPDAAAALALLPRRADEPCGFDIVLADYRLPGDSGLDLLKTLRTTRGLDIPVVMVTGQGSEHVAAAALRLGATDYLPKHLHYLQQLPLALEGAYHRVAVARQHAALQQLNVELERRVQVRTAELEAANRELDAFAYSVSHDLRAPLRAIDGLAALLQRDYQAVLADDGQKLLGMLSDSARRMDRLIRDLLDYARHGREPLQRGPVAMATLVRECIDERREDIAARGVVLTLGDLPACQGDARLLRRLWANLLDNALKFSSRQARPHIAIEAATGADGMCEYSIRDNGAGFDMRYAGKLFGVFQRLHRADEFEGTGVGLAIVSRIVERHGGRIRAEAAPGQGACFHFTLAAAALAVAPLADTVAGGLSAPGAATGS